MNQAIGPMLQDRRWAVMGVSADPAKFGTQVYRALQQHGYTVAGVNPRLATLDGETLYPDLASLPFVPEVVNVVVPPALARGVLEACLALGIRQVWFQPGAEDPAASQWGREQGLTVVDGGPCVLVELDRA